MTIAEAVAKHQAFLAECQRLQTKSVDEARARLDNLIMESAKVIEEPKQKNPQSMWITGSGGERFLTLNEDAVDCINDLFAQFKEVVQLLLKQEEVKKS